MDSSASHSPAPSDFDALLASISDAMQALAAWDIAAFQAAVERQRSICECLARDNTLCRTPADHKKARRVRELNRVYDRLLLHSSRWTRTIKSILQTHGNHASGSSIHFRA